MEYPLPQFLQIKPKVAGPLNLRQLIYIVSGAIVSVIFYFNMPLMRFVLLAIPIMGVSLAFAFGKIKGFPIPTILKRSFLFTFAGKKYIWHKIDAPAIVLPKAKPATIAKKEPIEATLRITEKSKLKKIANLIEIHPK